MFNSYSANALKINNYQQLFSNIVKGPIKNSIINRFLPSCKIFGENKCATTAKQQNEPVFLARNNNNYNNKATIQT